jgi:uridine kinase
MKAADLVSDAIRRLQRFPAHESIVVALDGHSGAGKSTLAAAVADTVDAAIVHVDDFYRDMPEAERLELAPAQGVDRYFDWERLRTKALLPLVQRERACYGCFDWVAGRGLTNAVTVDPRDILLIEGVYSARPEFDDLLDLRVLVEVAADKRTQRRRQRARTVSRDDPHGWDARWDAAERHYFHAVRPRDTFDLIVRGDW